MRTKCTAYKDRRRNASNNGSSVIAELTFSAARHEKTWSDFYSKSDVGSSFSTSSSGSTSGGGSRAVSGWSHHTVTGTSASTYGQPVYSGTYFHTNDPPNGSTFTGTGGGTGTLQQTTGVVPSTKSNKRKQKFVTGYDTVPPNNTDPALQTSTPSDQTVPIRAGGGGRRYKNRGFGRGTGGVGGIRRKVHNPRR
jgi:hypothetical protein